MGGVRVSWSFLDGLAKMGGEFKDVISGGGAEPHLVLCLTVRENRGGEGGMKTEGLAITQNCRARIGTHRHIRAE